MDCEGVGGYLESSLECSVAERGQQLLVSTQVYESAQACECCYEC